MSSKSKSMTVREAVGIFTNSKTLENAITALINSGFNNDAINLLASESTVQDSLGEFYRESHKSIDTPIGPRTGFVVKNTGVLAHDAIGTLILVGATLSGGVLLVSAGAFGSPLLAALSTAPIVGGITAVLLKTVQKSDADYLEEQLEMGHMLLFVRTDDADQEKSALKILSKHSAHDAKIYTVAAEAAEPA